MEKLITADGTEYTLMDGCNLNFMNIEINSLSELEAIADNLTAKDALKKMKYIYQTAGDGMEELAEELTDMKINERNMFMLNQTDTGKWIVTFSIIERTDSEKKLDCVLDVFEPKIQLLSDEQAVVVKFLYKTWEELVKNNFTAEEAGYRFTYGGVLYKTLKDNQEFKEQWIPGVGTESIFVRIDESHAGTKEDPIPYHANMEVFEGNYYIEDEILFKCTRNSEQALQNKASELVGHYFEIAEQ